MLDTIIQSSEITLTAFLLCTGVSLVLGVLTALLSQFREKSSQSFAIALAMLPAVAARELAAPVVRSCRSSSSSSVLEAAGFPEEIYLGVLANSPRIDAVLQYLQYLASSP